MADRPTSTPGGSVTGLPAPPSGACAALYPVGAFVGASSVLVICGLILYYS
ncbi:hypothetical protein [Streptomyces sp.]|uniref:hypothetical protein n=1 Tax=Streptomyces sp. TaxID=1931 RepID=UPI002810F58A|nr:hypothetical protein [Streptomyces sp.]